MKFFLILEGFIGGDLGIQPQHELYNLRTHLMARLTTKSDGDNDNQHGRDAEQA